MLGEIAVTFYDVYVHRYVRLSSFIVVPLLYFQVLVVKPPHSRGVNSERYVIAIGMTSCYKVREEVTKVLAKVKKLL